jgi:hypothetical protein
MTPLAMLCKTNDWPNRPRAKMRVDGWNRLFAAMTDDYRGTPPAAKPELTSLPASPACL